MLKGIFSNRLFLSGLAFFVLCVCGSLLYSWHVERTMEVSEFPRSDVVPVNPREAARDTVDTSTVDFGQAAPELDAEDTPTVSDATEALPNETEFADIADAFLPDDVGSEEAPAEEEPVSPFGFGPYPEVPADYPFTPFWLRYQKDPERYDAKYDTEFLKSKELLSRIMVKAWTEGVRDFTGGSFELTTGKYYLHLPNTIYVEYGKPYENEDGTFTRPFSSYTGGNVHLTHEQMQRGTTPTGIRVIEGGSYEPYEYLDLP